MQQYAAAQTDMLAYLINVKAAVQRDRYGCTPAYAAAQNNHVCALTLLDSAKGDVNWPNVEGCTPTSTASRYSPPHN